jgi:hypothetical protein
MQSANAIKNPNGGKMTGYYRQHDVIYFYALDDSPILNTTTLPNTTTNANISTQLPCNGRLAAIFNNKIYTIYSIDDIVLPVFKIYNTPTAGYGPMRFDLVNDAVYLYSVSDMTDRLINLYNHPLYSPAWGTVSLKSFNISNPSKVIFNLTTDSSSKISLWELILQNPNNPYCVTDPHIIRWTLDKPFSLVDAVSSNAKPSPLPRNNIYSVTTSQDIPDSYASPSLYRINHYKNTLISDTETTIMGKTNPLVQGGGRVLSNLNGDYKKYKDVVNTMSIKRAHKSSKKKSS